MPRVSLKAGAQRIYRQQTAEERRAARRRRLVDAAVEGFGTRGYAATSVDQLCADAGISTRNFYEEFPSREALLVALHDDVNNRAFDAVVTAVAATDASDIEARARAGVGAYLAVMTSDPRWARLAVIETVGASPAAEQHRRDAQVRFAELLRNEYERAADLGLASGRDYQLAAIGVVGALTELVSTYSTTDHHLSLDAVAAEAVRFVLAPTRREETDS